jgi:Predicted glycosyltransferases
MKTSIVIPAYYYDDSYVEMTQDCVDSLKYERPDEVIVVDDGSPIKSSISTIVLPENKGFGHAVNTGLERAKGDVLIISNNDIVFTPNWLTELLKPLKNGFDISSIVTSDQGWETKDLISEDDRFGSLWAMTRKVYKSLGGFDEQFGIGYFEDTDYYLRAKKAGFHIGKNWNGLVEHKGRATFSKVDPDNKYFLENKKKFINKWGFLI